MMKVLYHAVFMSYYHASTTCSFLYLDLVVSCLDSRHAVLKHVMIFMKYGMHAIFKIPFITCSSQALHTTQFSYHIVSAWYALPHAIHKLLHEDIYTMRFLNIMQILNMLFPMTCPSDFMLDTYHTCSGNL